MEDLRCKSNGDTKMQIRNERNSSTSSKLPEPFNLQNMRCYSASYAAFSSYNVPPDEIPRTEDNKFKRAKSMNGWALDDPELQRKKRIASYKVYSVERKVKGSFRNSFKWLKNRYSQVVQHLS